jgi:luciferase family oxidoreductase group 1
MTAKKISLSMLDLVAVREGGTVAQALDIAVRTAQHAETLGFKRYWLAEHHNMPGIASSATAVLVGHIAGRTQRMRIGSGGIMLPNHAPLVVAEAFGTLAELFPGRIDLGLGRAPGTDQPTMRALRRNRVETEEDFPREVIELQQLLAPAQPGQRLIATPGAGTNVPIWLLGSSLFSAQLAAQRGLPYAFASHFAPRLLLQAIAMYRQNFQPSATLDKPYVVIGVPLVAASTDDDAEFLASSIYQRVLGILRSDRKPLPPPVENFVQALNPQERAAIGDFLAAAVIGGPDTVRAGLMQLQEATQADEMMLVCDVFDVNERLRSLDIAASAVA